MHIQSIPMCKYSKTRQCYYHSFLTFNIGEGSSNNYAYLVVDDKSKDAVIIDPANPDELVKPSN